jgi:hypothetical protein
MSETQPATFHIRMKRFSLDKIRPGNSVLLIGMRETGKTVIAKDILWHNRDIPYGTVICGTDGPDAVYRQYTVPPDLHHYEYTPETIRYAVKRQRWLNKTESIEDRRAFLVIDDCLYDSSWMRDKYIRHILSNRSSLQTLFIMTMQWAMGIPPIMRENFDYVFILRENIMSNRRRLYEQYAKDIFPEFGVFSQVLNEVFQYQPNQTGNWHPCLVIDNTSTSTNVEDRVFHFTATNRRDLRLCADQFWTVKESRPA